MYHKSRPKVWLSFPDVVAGMTWDCWHNMDSTLRESKYQLKLPNLQLYGSSRKKRDPARLELSLGISSSGLDQRGVTRSCTITRECGSQMSTRDRPLTGIRLDRPYSFLCALPPSLRKEWAASYAHLSAENGLLITLQFPLDGDRKTGPPYSLSEELYHELLDGCWTKIWERAVPREESRASEGDDLGRWKEDRERLVVWKRR